MSLIQGHFFLLKKIELLIIQYYSYIYNLIRNPIK